MRNTNWEDQLKEGPYEAKANQIHLNNIQERVASTDKKLRRPGFNRMVPVTIVLILIASIVWLSNTFLDEEVKVAIPLSDNEIMQVINQSNPDSKREMLFQENMGTEGNLVFTQKMNTNKNGMTWEVGYINGITQKWTNGGGELWIDLISLTQHEAGQKNGFKNSSTMYIGAREGTPFPIIYGSFIDPKIAQIRITNELEYQQTARIIKNVHGGHSLWYALLPDSTNSHLKMEYIDNKGEVIDGYDLYRD